MSIMEISPSLMPCVMLQDRTSWVAVEPTDRADAYGKPFWRWQIVADGFEETGEDLAGWGNARRMLFSLLCFLTAAAESYAYRMRTGRAGDNENLFPPHVVAWAYQHDDELSALAYELEEEENGDDD